MDMSELMLIVAIASVTISTLTLIAACRINRSAIEFEERKAKLDFISGCLGYDRFASPLISYLSLARTAFPDSEVISDLLLSCEREADKLADAKTRKDAKTGKLLDANPSHRPFNNALLELFKEMCTDVGIPVDRLGDEGVKSIFLIGRYNWSRYYQPPPHELLS